MKENFVMYFGNVCRVLFQETRNINSPDRTTYLKWCMLMPSMKRHYVLYIVLITLGFLRIYWLRISKFSQKIKDGFFFACGRKKNLVLQKGLIKISFLMSKWHCSCKKMSNCTSKEMPRVLVNFLASTAMKWIAVGKILRNAHSK